MEKSDGRLDTRDYDEMFKNIEEWEETEKKVINIFKRDYIKKYGGEVQIENYGFREKGLEKDVTKIDIEPDFIVTFSEGPFKNKRLIFEVQGMEPDYSQFHIKLHKMDKAIQLQAFFIQMNSIGKINERYALISPEELSKFKEKSLSFFGIVGFPGTKCREFPNGKSAYRIKNEWLNWVFA
ncbi:MAG: hypothetical protein WC852_02995 [Candidatus Nanoarchaeia archaeon]|jgi:hypothetical protein